MIQPNLKNSFNSFSQEFEQFSFPEEYWCESCVGSENTLHQLSPYIGKLKSIIAKDLILEYSKEGDLIVDPFSGSGTIPLESVLNNRKIFAADISVYSEILTKGKLDYPGTEKVALKKFCKLYDDSRRLPRKDLRKIPSWIRSFFHPETLKECLSFIEVCNKPGNEFFVSCFLGVLHHQRPGFLSYPSSHLVPYLRDRKYGTKQYPEMYEYRDLKPRLVAKIQRAYKRNNLLSVKTSWEFKRSKIESLKLPKKIDCVITSPPYMNNLDYDRDNRLRLWFLNPSMVNEIDNPLTRKRDDFEKAMKIMIEKIDKSLSRNKYCILIVGEKLRLNRGKLLSERICEIVSETAGSFKLKEIIRDEIPDIRRSRRDYKGTKAENILIFKKS